MFMGREMSTEAGDVIMVPGLEVNTIFEFEKSPSESDNSTIN